MSLARDYLGLRGQQMGVEKDQLAVAESKVTALEKAVANAYTEGLKGGLDIGALRVATAALTEELEALRRHRAQLEAWAADAAAESQRMKRLWEMAETAHRRMAHMTLEERKTMLELLDVRVDVQGHAPLRLRVRGVIDDDALDTGDGVLKWRGPQVGRQGLEFCRRIKSSPEPDSVTWENAL